MVEKSLQRGSEYFSYSLCPPQTKSTVQIHVCVWSFVHRHDAYMCLLIVPLILSTCSLCQSQG